MENNQPLKNNKKAWWQPALVIFLKFFSWIAAPVILATFIGKWLDKKYNAEPWLFLVSVGVAFIISIIGIIINALREFKKIDKK
jgi:F0F1-type ATP synthase assembly protein I